MELPRTNSFFLIRFGVALLFSFPSLSSANQINISFVWNSSTHYHSLYACNAGIATNVSATTRTFNTVTGATGCTAGTQNCVEIDETDMEKENFLIATTEPWDATTPQTTQRVQSCKVGAGTCSAGSTAGEGVIFAVDSDNTWLNKITSLRFVFGSKVRSAQFFVDLCYRAPRDSNYELYDDYSPIPVRWELDTSVTVTTLGSGQNPFPPNNNPRLRNRTTLVCDVQGVGTRLYARDEFGSYTSLLRDLSISNITNGFTANLTNSIAFANVPETGTLNRHNGYRLRNGSTNRAPRFCVIRYEFVENTSYRLRDYPTQGSQISTYANFEIL